MDLLQERKDTTLLPPVLGVNDDRLCWTAFLRAKVNFKLIAFGETRGVGFQKIVHAFIADVIGYFFQPLATRIIVYGRQIDAAFT